GAVFGPLAAAASAGKIYELDAAGFESALGNAGTRAGALMSAQYKSMVKRMHHGMAAQAGLHGAALAAAGFVGIERVVEQEYGGMASTMLGEAAGEADLAALSRDLGEQWAMMDIGIKRHACLIMLHSTIDALIEQRPRIDVDEVDRIVIQVSKSVSKRTNWRLEPPGSPLGAQMNLAYAAAIALLDGAVYVDQFSPAAIARPAVWRLMDRIEVVHSEAVDALGTDRRFVTFVDIMLKDGSSTQVVTVPPQDREFSGQEVIDKYRGLVGGLIDTQRMVEIEDLVLRGGAGEGTSALADLLYAPVPPALDLAGPSS
ncbi:MAG: MmgE/PrpD family protein, partial [Dehalococcoidia bacterium]|nr:MmgE/PrpD family protein [Dehalococcoidia bacterium]